MVDLLSKRLIIKVIEAGWVNTTEMRAQIKALHRRLEATSIYVTHDPVEAMTMGDKIVVMREGVVQQFGNPSTSTTPRPTCSSPVSSVRPQ